MTRPTQVIVDELELLLHMVHGRRNGRLLCLMTTQVSQLLDMVNLWVS